MGTKYYRQYGVSAMITMALTLVFTVIAIVATQSFPGEGYLGIGIIIAACAFSILFLYKMDIYIDDRYIHFRMGVGFISRSYEISSISDCKTVKASNSGIRKIRNGWSYGVAGSKAVELHFAESKKVVKLGTKYPDEICADIIKAKERLLNKKKRY